MDKRPRIKRLNILAHFGEQGKKSLKNSKVAQIIRNRNISPIFQRIANKK